MNYFPRVRSKNHSLDSLRRSHRGLPALPVRSIVRFGSTTPTESIFFNKGKVVEINTVEAVKTSSSKLRMKAAFDRAGVHHPEWFTLSTRGVEDSKGNLVPEEDLPYPIVLKRIFGSRGVGMELLTSVEDLHKHIVDKKYYYLEKYYSYVREYRLHCTVSGCFYACRKMLKEGAENRWYRNDSNCVWYLDTNETFDRPSNWDSIVEDCVKALKGVGLDFGAFDVRVQSSDKILPSFMIIEVNSAPSFGEVTELKYKEILPKLIMNKANASNR